MCVCAFVFVCVCAGENLKIDGDGEVSGDGVRSDEWHVCVYLCVYVCVCVCMESLNIDLGGGTDWGWRYGDFFGCMYV
jgi:hypothetical protein